MNTPEELRMFEKGRMVVLDILQCVPSDLRMAFLSGMAFETASTGKEMLDDQKLAEVIGHGE